METWRQAATDGGLLPQVHELALNFALIDRPLIYAGLGEVGDSASAASELPALIACFPTATRAETLPELTSALAALDGPALFFFGPARSPCTAPLNIARALAVFTHAHGALSASLFPGVRSYFGLASPECASSAAACEATALELAAALCAGAPRVNQGTWKGVFRAYPHVAAPWTVAIPTPLIPASLWDSFTLSGRVGIGNFYIQELVSVEAHPVTRRPTTVPIKGREGVVVWDAARIAGFERTAAARGEAYYGPVDSRLYKVLDRHPSRACLLSSWGRWNPFMSSSPFLLVPQA